MSRPVLLASLLLLMPPVPVAWAQSDPAPEPEATEEPQVPEPAPKPPSLGLDSLLRPRGVSTEPAPVPKVSSALPGGRTEDEWRREFTEAHAETVVLQDRLRQTQQKIRESSTGEWGYTPTGAGMPSDPEVLKLRAELKRDKQSLVAAQTRLRDLDVEASLAGVPDAWREQD